MFILYEILELAIFKMQITWIFIFLISIQDTYAGMRDLYYKSGDGFLMVYSVTDSSSLEDVKDRYQSMLEACVSFSNLK